MLHSVLKALASIKKDLDAESKNTLGFFFNTSLIKEYFKTLCMGFLHVLLCDDY